MSDDPTIMAGVNFDDIGKGNTKVAKIINIVQNFNNAVIRLLKISSAKLKDSPQLRTIKRLAMLAINNNPDFIISISYKKLIAENVSEAICNSDVQFFVNRNYNISVEDEDKKEILFYLITEIKKEFNNWSDNEQSHVWELANILLYCSSLYNILQ